MWINVVCSKMSRWSVIIVAKCVDGNGVVLGKVPIECYQCGSNKSMVCEQCCQMCRWCNSNVATCVNGVLTVL